MKSDNATKTMLIRRHVLLLTLSSMSLAAPRLAAQQVQPTTDEVALQAFALDSLVAQGTDYYLFASPPGASRRSPQSLSAAPAVLSSGRDQPLPVYPPLHQPHSKEEDDEEPARLLSRLGHWP